MTEENNELTTDQKLEALMNGVYQNNQLLTRLVSGLDAIIPIISERLTPQQPTGPSYPQGYPVQPLQTWGGQPPQTPPNPQTTPTEFSNRFSEETEYTGVEEAYRGTRTYTHMGNVAQSFGQPPPNQPPPENQPPPTGPPPNDSGERMMTPDEYRDAHPE